MINSIVPVPNVADLTSIAPTVAASTDSGQTAQAAEGSSGKAEVEPQTDASVQTSSSKPATQPDVRLTIEENGDRTGYVYKMVDRFTGKTIAEIPREAVSQIGANESYSAGSVVSTSA